MQRAQIVMPPQHARALLVCPEFPVPNCIRFGPSAQAQAVQWLLQPSLNTAIMTHVSRSIPGIQQLSDGCLPHSCPDSRAYMRYI